MIPPSLASHSTQPDDADEPHSDTPAGDGEPSDLREQILDEFREQAAVEQFQKERPELWMQVQRVSKLLEYQSTLEDQVFPEGACFLHAGLPNFSCFSIRQVMEIDLDTCLVSLDIYSDHELMAGVVMLPLESIAWFGFPANHAPMDFTFQGFTGLAGA